MVTTNSRKRQRGRFGTVNSRSKRALTTKARHAQQQLQAAHAPQQTSNASAGDVNDNLGKVRARNRQAAHKYRQKKQSGTEELQARESIASDMNKSLNSEAAFLRSEVLMLKHMILQHSDCGSAYIKKYISSMAQSLVQSSLAETKAPGSMATEGEVQATSYTRPEVLDEDYMDWSMYMDSSVFDGDDNVGTSPTD
ncbi:bZIP transcription factor [Colletotrichum sp. SAR11_59]|nr:bZIP transcription factor [Colletotrichum sp. SAR11_59]